MYTKCHAKCTPDTPTIPADKLLLGMAPHLARRGILIEVVYSLKLGIFRVPGVLRMRHVGGRFWVILGQF